MYVVVYYTDTVCNLPTHSQEPYASEAVLNTKLHKKSLTEIVNQLFKGEHNKIFGGKGTQHITHGHPKMIILSETYPPKFPPTYDEVPSAYPAFFPGTGDRPWKFRT